jgi:hypothetical protein
MARTSKNPSAVQNLPSHHAMVSNIVSTYHRATPNQLEQGAQWYDNAREYAATLAAGSIYSLEQVACVIAALSPKQDWNVNKVNARRCVEAHTRGEELPSVHYPVQVAKARRALEGYESTLTILSGPKETAFYNNIIGSTTHVTIDRWAFKTATGVALGDTNGGISKSSFPILAEAYRVASVIIGVTLPTLQAVCWIVERGSAE